MTIGERIGKIWGKMFDSGRVDNIENAHEYLGHDPELTECYDVALSLAAAGHYDSALEMSLVLEKIHKQKKSETPNIVVSNLIGCMLTHKKEYGIALSRFDEALQNLPKNASNYMISLLYTHKADAEAGIGDLASAESSCHTAIKYHAKIIYPWRTLADINAKQGKHHAAIPLYKKAIKEYTPANAVTDYFFVVLGLVRSYMETGQKEKAEDTLEKLNEPPLSHSPLSNLYSVIKPQITIH